MNLVFEGVGQTQGVPQGLDFAEALDAEGTGELCPPLRLQVRLRELPADGKGAGAEDHLQRAVPM